VNVSSTGASNSSLQNGDEITFDLRLENATGAPINGLDVVVTGFDTPGTTNAISSGLQLVGGQVATSAFNTQLPDPGEPSFNGLENIRTAPVNIWALSLSSPQAVRTSLFAGVDTVSRVGNGNFDPGVGGGATLTDIHFRVTYRLVVNNSGPSQNLVLNFGIDESLGHIAVGPGGATIPFQNATYGLTVIPEPGTALLMGLGLAALATRRR